MGPVHLILLD